MARFLFVWELGEGWGHVLPLVDVVLSLKQRGHTVVLVARDCERARAAFRGVDVDVATAPLLRGHVGKPLLPQSTFAHLVFNTSAGEAGQFRELLLAWRQIYESQAPDVVVFDHSPTAMLAAHGLNFRTARFGTGFCCPVPESPFSSRRPEYRPSTEALAIEEATVLRAVNAGLESIGSKALEALSECLSTDITLLNTWPELDHGIDMSPQAARGEHSPQRRDCIYLGAWNVSHGEPPTWPAGKGKRVFLYTPYWPGSEKVLQMLERTRQPALAYVRDLPKGKSVGASTIAMASRPLDVGLVARECDLAIVHGGHGIVAHLLRAAVPMLVVPMVLEQRILGMRVEALGAGLCVDPERLTEMVEAWIALNRQDAYRQAAVQFARRYAAYDDAKAIVDCVERLESLAPRQA